MILRDRALLVGLDDADLLSALEGAGYDRIDVASVGDAIDRTRAGVECVVAAHDLDGVEGSRVLGGPSPRRDEVGPPGSDVEPPADGVAGTGIALCAAVREVDDAVPVVVLGDGPLEAVAAAAMRADLTGYVRRRDDGGHVEAVLEELRPAVDRYRSQRGLSAVAEDGPAGGCVIRDGVITYATPAAAALFGRETLEGTSVADLVAGADPDRVIEAIDAVDGHASVEFEGVRADGEYATIEAHWRLRGDAVVGTLIDVTDRTVREAEYREASQMLDSLLENVPLSIYFKDRQSRHERVSDHITRTDPEEYIRNLEGKVHPHAEDVIGKSDFDLYSSAFAEEVIADDRRVIEDEEPIVDRIEEGSTSLGEEQYTSTTKAPRYDAEGNVVGLVGITVDVTDRVQYRKELERQNERLNEFAEVLTHDLRNPVTIAQGYVDLLQDGHDPDAVDACSDALDRIDRLIEEIRAFVVQGRTVEEPEAVDLARAAREAWSTVETAGATLEVDVDRRIRTDPDRLRRLLENLFRNSVEHGSTSPGSSSTHQDAIDHGNTGEHADVDGRSDDGSSSGLTIRVESTAGGFAVADDGVGIPEEDLDQVFDRGYTTDPDGTGFGLAIVKNIAEAHGWTVSVGESADAGARFEFESVVIVDDTVGLTYGTK